MTKPITDALKSRMTSSGLIAPLGAKPVSEIKVAPEPEPQVEVIDAVEDLPEVRKPVIEVSRPEPRLNEIDLERRVSKLQARLNEFENEIAEFRSVHISRRGPAGPVGATGATGVAGKIGPKGDSIVGPPGPRGFPGCDSIVPGPKGDQGNPGSIEEATAAANKFVEIEMRKFRGMLDDVIRQVLRDCGATDEFGKAILIPGPVGQTGAPGRDGKDSTAPGPIGATRAPGRDGVDGKDSTVPGPPGRDGKDSTISGPRGVSGVQGLPGRDGKDSMVPGPPGPAGRNGIDGRDGIDSRDGIDGKDSEIPGPPGKPGNIDAAVINAEKAALKAVLQLLKDKKLID